MLNMIPKDGNHGYLGTSHENAPALSASGLRALRYVREVEGIDKVVALDNDPEAVEVCRRNIKFNGSVACAKVETHLTDACVYMLSHPKEFDMVDLDPYGSPSIFLDSAIQSAVNGGMLICTATDMAVLCGGNAEVCYSKYGSYPLRAKYCHEMALKIPLACIEVHPKMSSAIVGVRKHVACEDYMPAYHLLLLKTFLILASVAQQIASYSVTCKSLQK